MHLVQLLVPLYDNAGKRFPRAMHDRLAKELAERFGGVTAYARAPASGLWKTRGKAKHDDLIVYEVMTARLDVAWWARYRKALERRFEQDELLVRSQVTRRL